MKLMSFHPAVKTWFDSRFAEPTAAQMQAWPAIQAGRHVLIAAPTGSGKTLAAFLAAIDTLVRQGLEGRLKDETQVVYVSPLKALSNDIQRNLEAPLAGIRTALRDRGLPDVEIRTAVRTGDTSSGERNRMWRKPPHIVVTTPESLYVLLGSESGRTMLKTTRTVIVDEIHALAPNKRGSHLMLSLERLTGLCGRPLQRVGLSATQSPIEAVARFLTGSATNGAAQPDCTIVDTGHRRARDLALEVPSSPLEAVMSAEVWSQVYDRLAELIEAHRTTLIFVNTRRMAERITRQISERLGSEHVAAHHGSLSKEQRLASERRLQQGALKALVATASLELGIDIGEVDLVCQIGSPRSISGFLQRVGRSGHAVGGTPKGRLFPLSRDDLVECAALIDSVNCGELDRLVIPEQPLDVLAQQIVAEVSAREWKEDDLFDLLRRAWPYRALTRENFTAIVAMLAEGFTSRRGRRGALIHYDGVNRLLRGRRGARLTALTSGGTIPDNADYQVLLEPEAQIIGTLNEDFAVESAGGDIFQLGNTSYRILRVERGVVRVEDAQGAPPTIPFWLGEAPGRSDELSASVSRFRTTAAEHLAAEPKSDRLLRWLTDDIGAVESAAEQLADYLSSSYAALGGLPTQKTLVFERFFDEAGGMQLVIHSPYGSRINRAWGLALRKRFCVSFDRELQAAATDDGLCISLVEQHSFPLAQVFSMLRPGNLEYNVTQAALGSPMFDNRWRWNATRALAIRRHNGGRKVPVALQRIRAEDLLAAVFPEQMMCQDNRSGPVELPDHPLVKETIGDCLHEAMDIDGLREILGRIESGAIETLVIDTPAPSPMAHEILNANPYAFLDDAPLEERRARAVSLRRVDPRLAQEFGRLDRAAIDEVRRQAWPEARNPDELHDLLLGVGVLPAQYRPDWRSVAEALIRDGRATVATWQGSNTQQRAYVAAERADLMRLAIPDATLAPPVELPLGFSETAATPEEAYQKIVQGWLEVSGPITASDLGDRLGLPREKIAAALIALESAGVVLRGEFSGEARPGETEWCDRVLLARIHRLTLGRMRKEIEPVSATEFMRFLLGWQHAAPGTNLRGRDGILQVVQQLQGLELPAPAWEQHVLPARIEHYDPADLEHLCLAGMVAWGRLKSGAGGSEEGQAAGPTRRGRRILAPARNAPISFLVREDLDGFIEALIVRFDQISTLSPMALEVARYLERHGASFLNDIARATGLLKVKVEEALWQLVAHGLASGDGIAGLRVLLTPDHKRVERRRSLHVISGGKSPERSMPVGRWSLWRNRDADESMSSDAVAERRARQLLRRYGIVFRELLARETIMPPWRTLLSIYRRLEARGEIRGGRFVDGFVGEQFALPEAVDALRRTRRDSADEQTVIVSAADPLNLIGITTPGARVSPYSNQAIAYRDGLAAGVGLLGELLSRLQHLSLPKQV
ncbi:MAG: DEAD/DEAH box helicase [Candidatus Binatia bacterium]